MEVISNFIERRHICALFIFIFSFALFTPSLFNDFVWDDVEVITKSQVSFAPSNILNVIVPKVDQNKKARYYRPVIYASMVSDYAAWGVSSFGFHLSNLIFFSVSSVLFYFMALSVLTGLRIERAPPSAFLAAIIFAVHPIHVESVSWVAGRTDVLCGLFFFLAVIAHIASKRYIWITALTAISFALSLMSKEVAVSFVAVALVYDILSRGLFRASSIVRYAVYTGLLLLYFYLRGRAFVNIPEVGEAVIKEALPDVTNIQGKARAVSNSVIYLEALKTLFNSTLEYVNKLILPINLNAFISKVPSGIYYTVASAALILISAVASVFSIVRKENIMAFSILWIFTTLSPSLVVALYPIASTPLAERYLFLPSAGFCLLLGYLIVKAANHTELRRVVWAFGIVLVLVFTFLTLSRQYVWQSDLTLWRDATMKSPYHPLPHANYGLALTNEGEFEKAERHYRIALLPELNDSPRGKSVTANNLGLLYIETENYPEAEKWFNQAREFDPSNGRTYYHLGLINFIKAELGGGEDSYDKAEQYLNKALSRYYSFAKANLLLAKIYLMRGEIQKAKTEAEIAIQSGLPENLLDQAREILKVDDKRGGEQP